MNKPIKRNFDPTKPCRTMDGREARIICTDRIGGGGSLIALIKSKPKPCIPPDEIIIVYEPDGKVYYREKTYHPDDLINHDLKENK